ncbi:hypothetical protein N7U66_10875 [Lacinutrix neustonica]|uniref:Uncharacterized protein n=1 Tax=Lacinutrix neustonica TaxID=2980107 RepID=A0A9E8SC09_9FLAO|nr:hypothetical protein [Lacinutrix neustonica]WAC00798.1 hypothetical protein N7U66_10875 [Lacinutrix neustonica]
MINYTIYRVTLINKDNEDQVLNYFNGEKDFLEVCNQFYESLRENKVDYFDSKGNKRTFSISSNIDYQINERLLISHIDSGYTGENLEIRSEQNKLNYPVNKTEFQSRKVFSLFYVPKNSKYGYVVYENKPKHGVKVIFERQLQKFLKELGYQDYRVVMTPGLNFNYLSNMVENGKLKKVRLINYRLSSDIQLSLWKNVNLKSDDQDVREIKFKSKTENSLFKKELYDLFFSKINKSEKIRFMNQYEVDEISFEVNHNGASKTFYIKDKACMRANVDVSKRLDIINGEATYESMKMIGVVLIKEILDFGFSYYNEVA